MEYEELNEFAQKVKAGEITNFEPYFQNQNQDQLRRLKQICILHGAYQEAYLDWASDGRDTWIQHMLAKHGYCLDTLIQAEDTYVRESALEQNIRLALKPGFIKENLGVVRAALMSSVEPDKEVLDAFVKEVDEYKEYYDCEALYLKHATHDTEPTAIEKTMTPLQLYKVGNPLWTRPYTGEQVALVNQTLRDPLNDKTADLVFGAITAGAKTSGDLLDYMLNSRIQPTIP